MLQHTSCEQEGENFDSLAAFKKTGLAVPY